MVLSRYVTAPRVEKFGYFSSVIFVDILALNSKLGPFGGLNLLPLFVCCTAGIVFIVAEVKREENQSEALTEQVKHYRSEIERLTKENQEQLPESLVWRTIKRFVGASLSAVLSPWHRIVMVITGSIAATYLGYVRISH